MVQTIHMSIALTGAIVFDGDTFLERCAVVIDRGRIVAVVPDKKLPANTKTIDLKNGYLVPGFIDVQVNGGGGALLNGKPDIETVKRIAASHRKFGTTGMLPTVISDSPAVITSAIEAVTQAVAENFPGILGIHIEGPFLDKARKGAHAARYIRDITTQDIKQITSITCGTVMLTVAPNRVSPKHIRKLSRSGVHVSLGHSDATCDEAIEAVAAGASAFTHLYNAMSQMTGREPGMVGAAMACNAFVGLIADGHHVHAAALRAAIQAKGIDRCMLITDAMPTAADGPASFTLQRRRVARKRGMLTLADGTLAGSNLTMDKAVRFCVQTLGLDLGHILRMASRTPAEFLGRGKDLGHIAPGYLANLVHLDKNLKVKQTWINGK